MSVDTVSLTGWGRTAPTTAVRFRPRSYEEAAATVLGCGPRGSIARGLGRTHGDAAQNAGGSVLDMTALDRIRTIDAAAGLVVCDAGTTLDRLREVMLPLGWFLPVVPGGRYVTVGGAIGSDAHGDNHRAAGSFTRHVTEFTLLTADGELRTVRPGSTLFDATAGGLGLTGVVLAATLRLRPVSTALMTVDTERAAHLDDLLARMARGGHHPYEYARLDLTARGRATGRGVLVRADHVPLDALPASARRTPLALRPPLLTRLFGRLSATAPGGPGHRPAFRPRTGELRPLSAFFRALDAAPHRDRVFPTRGRVHYAFLVGHGREDTLRRIVGRIARSRCPVFRAVLRRCGEGGPGWLSFPAPGWNLSLDLPAGLPGLPRFLDSLDEEVAAAGGRVSLTEDSRLRPDVLAAMYPRLPGFRALRAELDPAGAFRSDLSRRLSL
ncbi:FAD-binding oxidoreductase [Streptomyces sp. NPDC088864]|uniref:FAD-binding oxidoreductase n=1 Tax=Streptomyces sp. NPDC088864 TaxID=3365910 RepID=UPI00382B56E1